MRNKRSTVKNSYRVKEITKMASILLFRLVKNTLEKEELINSIYKHVSSQKIHAEQDEKNGDQNV